MATMVTMAARGRTVGAIGATQALEKDTESDSMLIAYTYTWSEISGLGRENTKGLTPARAGLPRLFRAARRDCDS